MFNLNLFRWLQVTTYIYGRLLLPLAVILPSEVAKLPIVSCLSSVPCSHPPRPISTPAWPPLGVQWLFYLSDHIL